MCRWMAWFGQPLVLEELLFNTPHGIIDQSLHARMGAEPTNGDGFGVGWYGIGASPGRYRSVSPAWSDPNLRELATHIESPTFFMHIRAAIGSPVQQTNCHPFRHDQWLFVHNGFVNGFHEMRRDLMVALDPERFADVEGSTDSEVVFQLALTYGLERDPIAAMERAVGHIEDCAVRHGIESAVQGSFGISDGHHLWAVRYATEGPPRSLYMSADPDAIKRLHPENERFQRLTEDDRLVVSEPFSDLPGVWEPIAEGTALTVRRGGVHELRPFRPQAPAAVPAAAGA